MPERNQMSDNSNQNLYFLRLLQEALEAENPRRALLEAIERIRALGSTPEYQEGYANFLIFVKVVEEALATDPEVAESAKYLNVLRKEIAQFTEMGLLAVEVFKNGELFGSIICSVRPGPLLLRQITPGLYEISLSNGRLLWSGQLKDENLRWSLAHPDTEYPAAAMTEPMKTEAAVSELLLGGSVVLEVFPGIESGAMQIRINNSSRSWDLT